MDAMLLREWEDVWPPRDEGLLIGQADVLARLDGGAGRLQARAPDDACTVSQPRWYSSPTLGVMAAQAQVAAEVWT